MATVSPLWPTDINKHLSWPFPWSHGASAPRWSARDSPLQWRMSLPLAPYATHTILFFLNCCSFLSSLLCFKKWEISKKRRERAEITEIKRKAEDRAQHVCLLWVCDGIMRGLQCLVGGSFYSDCQDKCAIIQSDWVHAHARTCERVWQGAA